MDPKADRIAKHLTAIISSWPGVECILACEASRIDVMDPYFALVLDVYYSGTIPGIAERQAILDDPGAFQTSRGGEKDRFFLDGLPIRVEYKKTKSFDQLISKPYDMLWLLSSSGSYIIYRFLNGEKLFARSDWLDSVKLAINDIKPEFWEQLAENYNFKIEHALSDLGGAALKEDSYFYLVSLTGFLKACVSALFAYNKEWEPSERLLTEELMKLPALPKGFSGLWELLLKTDGSVEPSKKYRIAQQIAASIIKLE